MKTESSPQISAYCAGAAIIFISVSISASQISMALSILSLIIETTYKRFFAKKNIKGIARRTDSFLQTNKSSSNDPLWFIHRIYLAGAILFFTFLASASYHFFLEDTSYNFYLLIKKQGSDFFIYLFGFTLYLIAKEKRNSEILLRSFYIFSAILIFSGAVGVFTKFRLMKMLMGAGSTPTASNRLQHNAFQILGIQLHNTVGFMNTRLTYAGLLGMTLPILFSSYFSKKRINGFPLKYAHYLVGLGLIVLFLNQTRSILPGVLFGMILVLFYEKFPNFPTFLNINKTFLKIGAGLTLLSTTAFLLKIDTLSFLPLQILERQTDVYRPIIWAGSGTLFSENWIFGVGPGRFKEATLIWRYEQALLNPELWHYFTTAPDGHAHNDLLHVLTIGGIFSGLAFLALLLYFLYGAITKTIHSHIRAIFVGAVVLIPAGLFQCYFQDDEVVALFWSLPAIAIALRNNHRGRMPSDSAS